MIASCAGGVADICKRWQCFGAEKLLVGACESMQRFRVAGRQRQQVVSFFIFIRWCFLAFRCLLNNDMSIGASQTKRTDTRDTRRCASGPGNALSWNPQ